MKHICHTLLFAATVLLGNIMAAQNHFTERDTIDVLHYDIRLDMGHHYPRHIQGSCEVTLQLLQPTSHVKVRRQAPAEAAAIPMGRQHPAQRNETARH